MDSKIKVIIGGDVSCARFETTVDEPFCRHLLRDMLPVLQSADLRIANLESVLCEKGVGAPIPKSGPNLMTPSVGVSFFTVGGFEAVAMANNHFGDYGVPAIESTLQILDENKIAHFGGGRNKEEAYRAYRVNVKGISLSFLSVCENEFGIATETTPGAAGFDLKYLRDRIIQEKKEAEFVIVIFHGGNEQNPVPAPVVVDRYRLLIDLGADAVVAGHTHCMQGAELYCGKPIIYSMGNYFFPSGIKAVDDAWNWGYLTELTIERGVGMTYNLIPYALQDNNTHLHVLDGAQREVILSYIDRLSAIIAHPAEVRRYYEAWATHLGAYYISRFDYKKEYETSAITEEQLWEFSPTKNLLGCEAHNDLIRTLTQLIYEGRFDQAHAHLEELQELQKIPQA